MKMKKLGLLALTLGLGISLAACNESPEDDKNNDDNPGTTNPENPGTTNPDNPGTTTPESKIGVVTNVSFNKDTKTISWDKADKATGYIINVNGSIFNSTTTNYQLEEAYLDSFKGCHIDIKVSAINNQEQGAYSEKLSVLIGEDTITDEAFAGYFENSEIWDLETAKAFMEKNNISKTEFLLIQGWFGMAPAGASAIVSKDRMALMTVQNLKLELEKDYTTINPDWIEGQDKKLVKYIDDNFDELVKTVEIATEVYGLASNQAIMEALGRLEEIPNGTITLDSLLNLYSNIQTQLNESIPTEEDIEKLLAKANEVLDIVLEENKQLSMQVYASLFTKEELGSSLTEEQLSKLKKEVSKLLGNVDNILNSTLDLVKSLYSNISNSTLEKFVNLKSKAEENSKYLLNEHMVVEFEEQYAIGILANALIEELKTEDALNSLMGIVNELKAVTANENIAQLIDTLFATVELPEGVSLGQIINQCLGLVSKEEINGLLSTISLVTTPLFDAKYVAALVFTTTNKGDIYNDLNDKLSQGLITNEEYSKKISEIEKSEKSAPKDMAIISYGAVRDILNTISDEELALVASMLEGVVLEQLNQTFTQNIVNIEEEMEYYNTQIDNIETENDYLNYINNEIINEQKNLDWYEQNKTEDKPYTTEIDDCKKQLISLEEQKEQILQDIENEKTYLQGQIDELEQQIQQMEAYKKLLGDFASTEHDYTEQYFNVLKDLKQLINNIESSEVKDILDLISKDEYSDAILIDVIKIIVNNNGTEPNGIIEDILKNAKVVAGNSALADLELTAMIEQFEQIVGVVKEIATYDAENLTPEQIENIEMIKEMIGLETPGVDVKVILTLENVLGTYESNFGEKYTISDKTVITSLEDEEFTYNIISFMDNTLYAEDALDPTYSLTLTFSLEDETIVFVNSDTNDKFVPAVEEESLIPSSWAEGTYISEDSSIYIAIMNGKLAIGSLDNMAEVVIGSYDEATNTLYFKEDTESNSITMNEDGSLTYNGVVYELRRNM